VHEPNQYRRAGADHANMLALATPISDAALTAAAATTVNPLTAMRNRSEMALV